MLSFLPNEANPLRDLDLSRGQDSTSIVPRNLMECGDLTASSLVDIIHNLC